MWEWVAQGEPTKLRAFHVRTSNSVEFETNQNHLDWINKDFPKQTSIPNPDAVCILFCSVILSCGELRLRLVC